MVTLMLGVSHVVEVFVLGLLVVVEDSRATRDNQMYTHRKSIHTLGNEDTTQRPARDSEGELAAAAAAPPPPPPPLLLLLLLLCCCCAAAVLLLCCCCAEAASRSAMHRGAQPVSTDCFSFCVLWNARRSE